MRVGAVAHVERTLSATAALLFLLAGALWWRASRTALTIDTTTTTLAGDPPWWAGAVLGIAVALAAGTLLSRRFQVGRAAVGVALATLAVTACGGVIWWRVLPEPDPLTAVGPAVSATVLGFAVALFACLLTGLGLCLRGASGQPALRRASQRSTVTTAIVALTVTGLVGVAVVHADRGYLLRSNEYRSSGDVGRPPADGYRSQLTGGSRWQIQIPGLQIHGIVSTPWGLALVSGSSVVAVDTDTGAQRWRYARSDATGTPQLVALDGGRRLLVWWDPAAPYVLDARTGRRLAHWSWPRGQQVLLGDPLIVQRPTEDASTIVALSPSGDDLWSRRLTSCDHPYAGTGDRAVLLSVLDNCERAHSHVQLVSADSGAVRWTAAGIGGPVLTQSASAALFAESVDGHTVVSALRLSDGSATWSREVRFPDGERPCNEMVATAAGRLVMIACSFEVVDALFNSHPKGLLVEQDLASGRPLRTRVFDGGLVDSLAIDSSGRKILTYDHTVTGCLLARLTDSGPRDLAIDPDDSCHCSFIGLQVRGQQVILVDHLKETISSLR